MKILCFIDSLGSGGAQRQLTSLAVRLKERGHDIRFLVYHQHDYFLPVLQAAGIQCDVIPPCNYIRRVFAVRRYLGRGWQDTVLAFLEAACFYAELAQFPNKRWGLVVGERSANPSLLKGLRAFLRRFHCFADFVVANSHTTRLLIQARFPFLTNKVTTIYNLVDLEEFRPVPSYRETPNSEPFRLIIAASYLQNKNLLGVAKAILYLRLKEPALRVHVDWYGDLNGGGSTLYLTKAFILEHKLSETMTFYPATKSIFNEFARADAVGLFSFYEGLPNVICEGMAAGKPIILSNVCDASNLVYEGKNGFLCDPNSPESIAQALSRIANLPQEIRAEMGAESRKIAEHLFSKSEIVNRYEQLLTESSSRRRTTISSHWPPVVPDSAKNTVYKWKRKQ